MSRNAIVVLATACLVASVVADKADPAKTKAPPSYPSLSSAVTAAAAAPQLTTLIAAVKAAGVAGALTSNTTWTILAPTNKAFEKRLAKLNVTADALLKNKELLIKILSYHVIPSGAVYSSQLQDNQAVATALKGATLTVKVYGSKVAFKGPVNKAKVIIANIKAGNTVIHVIDDVLVPPGTVSAEVAQKWKVESKSEKDAYVKKVSKP
jgi:uncharacterized surface protein with fasciclin (FAS1) repeats